MGVKVLAALLVPVLTHALCCTRFLSLLRESGLVRANFRGRLVPTSGGLLLLLAHVASMMVLMALAWLEGTAQAWREPVLLLCGAVSMALWGFWDDWAADQESKGFRGHFAALLREGRITSGLWKAAGGGITSCLVAVAISAHWSEVLVRTLLLALSANLLNLFDLRPGRAIKVFWLLVLPALLLSGRGAEELWYVPAVMASFLMFGLDARGRLMLGDTGANYLGFVAGYLLIWTLPLSGELVMALLFLALNLASEYISFSRVIQANPLLARLDRWGCEAAWEHKGV